MKIEQFKKNINRKAVAVVGIGISNTPLIKMLIKLGAKVIARDKKTYDMLGDIASELEQIGVNLILGDEYLENLTEDIIFKTPGMRIDIPELVSAKQNGSIITSEMEVFFDLCPASIIAVTGSDGKTTTTTLIYEILKAQGYNCHLGGNIGKPLLSEVEGISVSDKVVLELSSFQLHTMKPCPEIAVITNVTPNHLDIHKSMEEYINAKKNIFAYQNKNNKLILNFDNDITKSFAEVANSTVIPFGLNTISGVHIKDGIIYMSDTTVLKCEDILLPGEHNIQNYMAAIAAVWGMVEISTIQHVAKSFSGVEHRIEFVRELDGVKFYNDSIASSPTRTRACLYSFDKKVIIIAGGYDKKIPFDEFGKDIVKRVKTLVLMGATSEKIKTAVENAEGEKPPVIMAESLEDAVIKAKSSAEIGDVIILSPACASFDMYKNFEERGNKFKQLVMNL